MINFLYQFISFFIRKFPHAGSRIIDTIIFALLGNPAPSSLISKINRHRLRRMGNVEKVCVLCDMNIGDAILVQEAILSLRHFFPDARIDYIVNRTAKDLISENPEISNLFAVYSGSTIPADDDIQAINGVLARTKYDLVFNFCPFISGSKLAMSPGAKFISYHGVAAAVLKAAKDPWAKNHMLYQTRQFIQDLFSRPGNNGEKSFRGGHIYLSAKAVNKAEEFMSRSGLDQRRPRIFFNPDASCRFTRMPLGIQVDLLKRLAELPINILLGAGHTKKGIEFSILKKLPEGGRRKIKVVPAATSIDVYAAIIDKCDIYITGDTGPLHIAAARKHSGMKGHKFRNQTAVFSIFGATPPRIYGYDSRLPGFFPANQDAPSHVYVAPSSFRNMACIAKKFITCDPGCFFDSLEIGEIISDIRSYLNFDWQKRQQTAGTIMTGLNVSLRE